MRRSKGTTIKISGPGTAEVLASLARQQKQYTDDELRAIAKRFGGSFHGPIVETLSIPEAKFFEMMREVLKS